MILGVANFRPSHASEGTGTLNATVPITVTGEGAGDDLARLAHLGMGDGPKGRQAVTVGIDGHLVGWLTAHATLQPAKPKGHEDEIDVELRVHRGWGHTR